MPQPLAGGIMKHVIVLLLICFSVMACNFNSPPKNSKIMTSPSGKTFRVYSIQRISFANNIHPPSLMLRYETKLPINDSPELRSEVLEAWELLRPMADEAGDTYAMVKANEPIKGVFSTTQGFTYGFIKENDIWKMREPKS